MKTSHGPRGELKEESKARISTYTISCRVKCGRLLAVSKVTLNNNVVLIVKIECRYMVTSVLI
jgi:hypothetical protein